MITLYSGTPGSGKSLHLAQTIHDRLKYDDCVIIANFPFNVGRIKGRKRGRFISIDNNRLFPERLIDFAIAYRKHYCQGRPIKEGRFTLIIDECQILFNSREWQMAGRNAWLSFFTQHRKFGFDIILVSQFDRMIDRQIRSLIEYEKIHRKVNNYGIFGKILAILCGGNLFVSVYMWYPLKQKLGAEFFLARRKYYSLYDTYKMFDTVKS